MGRSTGRSCTSRLRGTHRARRHHRRHRRHSPRRSSASAGRRSDEPGRARKQERTAARKGHRKERSAAIELAAQQRAMRSNRGEWTDTATTALALERRNVPNAVIREIAGFVHHTLGERDRMRRGLRLGTVVPVPVRVASVLPLDKLAEVLGPDIRGLYFTLRELPRLARAPAVWADFTGGSRRRRFQCYEE